MAEITLIESDSTLIAGVISTASRAAREECASGSCLGDVDFDACVYHAVASLWESRVKTCVPLLALRRVRCCIRTSTCECGEC